MKPALIALKRWLPATAVDQCRCSVVPSAKAPMAFQPLHHAVPSSARPQV